MKAILALMVVLVLLGPQVISATSRWQPAPIGSAYVVWQATEGGVLSAIVVIVNDVTLGRMFLTFIGMRPNGDPDVMGDYHYGGADNSGVTIVLRESLATPEVIRAVRQTRRSSSSLDPTAWLATAVVVNVVLSETPNQYLRLPVPPARFEVPVPFGDRFPVELTLRGTNLLVRGSP